MPDVAAGQVIPLEGVRRVIAERMQQSLQGSAQVTLVADADARRFHELRTELASRHESALGFRISYNDLLIRICAHALREHPRANSSLEGDAIRLHDVVNVGLAIEAGGDLVVANVKSADRKSLVEIASDLRGVVDRAQAPTSLDLDDITGGTFTISNLGVYGIDAFTPVLNPPESAILGVGALREKAVARDGEVSCRTLHDPQPHVRPPHHRRRPRRPLPRPHPRTHRTALLAALATGRVSRSDWHDAADSLRLVRS